MPLLPNAASWTAQYNSGGSDDWSANPATYVQVVGSGTVVLTCDDGSTATLVCVGGEVFPGVYTALVSTTATRVNAGNGQVPPAVSPSGTAAGVTLADAGGFFTTDTVEAALQQLGPLGLLGGITKLQLVTGTFVSGLCTVTVGANQAVTANTRAFPVMQAVVTGSTNLGGITHMFASNVVGGSGVGQVLFRLLGSDGATDVDAAGAFAAILVN